MSSQRGYTLIELVVSIGILSVLLMMSGTFFTDVLKISRTIDRSSDSLRAGRAVIDEFTRTGDQAVALNEAASSFGVAKGKVSVQLSGGQSSDIILRDGAVWS